MDPALRRDLLRLGLEPAEAEALARGDSANLGAERSFRLVALDVDAVQAHVFASPRPITIEGASALLRVWDQRVLRELVEKRAGVALLFAGGATYWLARLFEKRIGGYTGDCLGATQQFAELAFYGGLLCQFS